MHAFTQFIVVLSVPGFKVLRSPRSISLERVLGHMAYHASNVNSAHVGRIVI